MVNLVTVKDRELMKVGTYQLSTGEFECTPELIQAAIKAHEAGVLRKPVARLGHNDPRFSGDPAVGFFDNLRVSDDGTTLYGDHVGVPQWLAENMASAYPSLSIEGMYDYTAPDGTQYDFILTGVGLLGATAPGIGSLKSVQDLESLYGAELADVAAAVGEIGGTPVQLTVQAATDPKPYGNVKYADPKNGKYPIDTAEHVRAAWSYINMPKNAAEYSSGELAQIKSRIKSAAKKFGIKIEASSASEIEKGAIVVASLKEQMAEKLGLDPDADEDAILEAFTQATEKAAEAPPEPVAASAAVTGLMQIDEGQYRELVAAAEAGRRAEARQIAEDDERVVMAAIKDGRIAPARKAHWLTSLQADREGTKQVLASLAPGLVPTTELGHSNPGPEGDIDPEMAAKQRVEDRIFASLRLPKKAGSN